ncbi:HAMP domain-containing protein, partial [Schumannella luteola]
MRRVSVRVRLAIGSTLLALVLLAVALLVTRGVVDGMLTDIDASLARADLAPFAEQIGDGGGESLDEPAYGVLVRIVDPAGQAVVDTMPHELHEQVEHRAPADTEFRAEVHDVPYTIAGETVETAEGTWALWAARSSESTELALHGLDLVLVVGGLLLLALFAVASWLLARAALAPVERMRRAAAELPAEGDTVLPVGEAHDELAQLAATLNDFLRRIRASTAREKQMVSDAAHELRTPVAALRTR